MFYKKIGSLILLVMVPLLLNACGKPTTEAVLSNSAVCQAIRSPIDNHMNAIIDEGDKILSVSADEVVVTASELSDSYQATCYTKP